MIITKELLKEKNACESGIEMFNQVFGKPTELEIIIKAGIKSKNTEKLKNCSWLITRVFTRIQNIKYAIYAAKQVLHIWNEKYPEDKRPEKAIKAAEKYLKNPTEKNRKDAYAASASAYAAAYAAAAAASAYAALRIKILKYGLKLLKEEI